MLTHSLTGMLTRPDITRPTLRPLQIVLETKTEGASGLQAAEQISSLTAEDYESVRIH